MKLHYNLLKIVCKEKGFEDICERNLSAATGGIVEW